MFLGFLIGVLLGGFFSDKFGRRLLVYIPCSMCNVVALLASFVHVYWLYVLLRVLVGVFVGKKDLFQIGSGKGGPDPAFPHSRIFPPLLFLLESLFPNFPPVSRFAQNAAFASLGSRKVPVMQAATIFPKSSASRAHILASHFPSSSQILYPI